MLNEGRHIEDESSPTLVNSMNKTSAAIIYTGLHAALTWFFHQKLECRMKMIKMEGEYYLAGKLERLSADGVGRSLCS